MEVQSDDAARTDAPVLNEGSVSMKPDVSSAQIEPKSQPQTPNATTLCGVCNTNAFKYKCPRCYLPYCSVACNKVHRENHPEEEAPKPIAKPAPQPDPTPAPNGDPKNPFRALGVSERLKALFAKYPNLPDQLLKIHSATLPPPEEASSIPSSILASMPKKKDAWNHDVGIRNGKAALRRARKVNGEEGDAIREYSELVLYLLNEGNEEDVDEVVRQQMAQKDTQLIESLLAEERSR